MKLKLICFFNFKMNQITLSDEFLKNLKIEISLNPYLTDVLINYQITKPLYVTKKGSTDFKALHEYFSTFKYVWSYWMIIAWIHYFPDHVFWTPASGFPDYLVSTEGDVWSTYTHRLMSLGNFERIEENDSYVNIGLTLNQKEHHISLHKLILKSFLPDGYNEFTHTNHKDGKKRNMILLNLEPSDKNLNPIHSQRVLGKNNFVEIKSILISNDNNEQEEILYECIRDAAAVNDLNITTLVRYIDEETQVQINGKWYKFTRETSKREREYLNITYQQFYEEFMEIKGIITVRQKNGNLLYFESKSYFISRFTSIVVTIEGNKLAIIKSLLNNHGYPTIILYGEGDPKGYHRFLVSRLVLFVFGKNNYVVEHGKRIDYWDLYADHIDHIITNNSSINLQWITAEFNRIRSVKYKPIRITNNCSKTVTVLPASKVLSELCGYKRPQDIRNVAKNKGIFWGSKIEYITLEEYHREKVNNTLIILFSESANTIEKYDIQTKKLIKTFDSSKDAASNIGLNYSSSFCKGEVSIFDKENDKDYYYYYIDLDNDDGYYIETPLKYNEATYHNFLWNIIYGKIKVIDLNKINEKCDDIEHYYVKMSKTYLD